MKRTIHLAALVLGTASVAHAQTIVHQSINPNTVTRVETALNHISLIELPEPVLRVAIGSEDFKIEYHGNTVALKPAKQGQATNLFVWTEHTKSSYEILPPGDVKTAAFIIDQTDGKPLGTKPAESEKKISEEQIQQASDLMVAQTMLEALPINNRGVKDSKDRVSVRITEVVREKSGLYVRYTVTNEGQHPYRVSDPAVSRFTPATGEELGSLKGSQLAPKKLASLGSGNTDAPAIRQSRIENRDLTPGQSVDAIISFGIADEKPHVYRFVFANDESRPVEAAVVL